MRKLLLSIALMLLVCLPDLSMAQTKANKNIRVLYVGANPEHKVKAIKGQFESQLQYETRLKNWADYGEFLSKYFDNFRQVDGHDYKPEMSAAYDVTIFDILPAPMKIGKYLKDGNGKIIGSVPAEYLPKDFDDACITLGFYGALMGTSLKSKIDWA